MSKHTKFSLGLALSACLLTGFAQAAVTVSESEPNNTIDTPQTLNAGSGVTVQNAWMGNSGTSNPDLDFYTFYATQGDSVTINIDSGYDGPNNTQAVDLTLGLYKVSNKSVADMSTDASSTDAGSPSFMMFDPRIDNYMVTESGFYTVVVCGNGCIIGDQGVVTNLNANEVGNYYLTITGASGTSGPAPTPTPTPVPEEDSSEPVVTTITAGVEVRPNDHAIRPANPHSRGKIPVAIVSIPGFNPLLVDTKSLTFGATGDEDSLVKCQYQGHDLNHDGVVDRICFFDNQKAGFSYTDAHGILKGKLKDGTPIEGKGYLKVVPDKR